MAVVDWADFIISYGYWYIIKKDIIDNFPDKIINLHISYLPYNRGRDPNFWSWIENTPKGVTIHYINEGVDTGDILFQKEVKFGNKETLRTSYDRLRNEIEILFMDSWHKIKSGRLEGKPQKGKGSFHKGAEKDFLNYLLIDGWDTPVSILEKYGRNNE